MIDKFTSNVASKVLSQRHKSKHDFHPEIWDLVNAIVISDLLE